MNTEQKLKKQVDVQQKTISRLSSRMSELSDLLAILENDVERFKHHVSTDLKKFFEISQRQ